MKDPCSGLHKIGSLLRIIKVHSTSMEPFGLPACLCALTGATALAIRAHKKQSLTTTGCIAGFAVGGLLVVTGLRGINLFVFYHLGSMATKVGKSRKAKMDASVATHAVRGAKQVLAVSVIACGISLYHALVYGSECPLDFEKYPTQSQLACAVLAHHATSLGDTWASELGMLISSSSSVDSKNKTPVSWPILVTQPWRRVPPGTNGGITLLGTVYTMLGGLVMGLTTVVLDVISGISTPNVLATLVYGAVCGGIGSLVDSLLGATVQVTYCDTTSQQIVHSLTPRAKHICGRDILTNEQVNFVSVALTTVLGGWVLAPAIYSYF